MTDTNGGLNCTLGAIGAGVLVGVIAGAMLMLLGDWSLMQAIFMGLIVTAGLSGFLYWFMCTEAPAPISTETAMQVARPVVPAAAAAPAAPGPMARPAGLAAARGGRADDLKKIKGVGPKLEELLHRLGYYHYDQIAAWTPAEVAWVDENLEGFKGRVSRDGWVAQAKVLAAGGETEFSRRVGEGEVY